MISEKKNNVVSQTGNLYSLIWDQFNDAQWEKFSDDHFFEWSPLPLGDSDFFKGKICLDAGCGSGRAIRSMLLAGAQAVYGIDIGEGCIRNSLSRNSEFEGRLEVMKASVLDIPFAEEIFDFVHCDGVLHHTTNPYAGFRELARVLKPNGTLVFAVYGRGGLMNFAIKLARAFKRFIPPNTALKLCKKFSSNPVMWYAVMDCMYVPIRETYSEKEIKKWIEELDFIRPMKSNSSWGPYRYGRWMSGEGYLKFMATKRA